VTPRRGVPAPNYTQAPNVLLDELLPEIKSLAELKVILVVVRQTIGWHEDEQRLTFSDLEDRTGLSRQSVNDGVKAAVARGVVERRVEGPNGAQEVFYALNVTGQESRPVPVKDLDRDRSSDQTASGQGSGPVPIEERNEKETPPSAPLAGEGGTEWDKVLEDLRTTVPATTFHWLQNVILVARDGDRLILQAPAEQAKWVRQRFLDKELAEAVARVLGPGLELSLPESETERMRRELDERGETARRAREGQRRRRRGAS
jgi:phage replication O-like protein O